MTRTDDLANMIKCHENTKEIIKVITSDFDYYNSLLLDGELTINHNKIKTRTTFLGLAALYKNNEVLYGLLKNGVPADGLDLFLYRYSLFEVSNYHNPNLQRPLAITANQHKKCWSTTTEIVNSCDEYIFYVPWSTPVILAILSENSEGLMILLDHGATCDLRHNFYADSLSLCENEEVMKVLLNHPETHLKETTARILIVFNVTLAKFLYNLGIKPDENIIARIKSRYTVQPNNGFFAEYNIDARSKLWEDFYQKRAEECIKFYKSMGYIEYSKKMFCW